MILLVDVGNSRLKWAEYDVDGLSEPSSMAYGDGNPVAVFQQALGNRMEHADRLIVSSVLGQKFDTLISQWSRQDCGRDVEFVSTQASAYGISVAYDEPDQLGVDRFVALIAAHAAYSSACIVIDCGTAITIDALSAAGVHLGGVILPGLELMSSSLSARATGIRHIDSSQYALFGKSTSEAVSGGVYHTVIAAINHITGEMLKRMDGPVTCIICGGSAELLLPAIDQLVVLESALILKGLAVVASE